MSRTRVDVWGAAGSIAAQYRAGVPTRVLAARHGCGRVLINRVLRSQGISNGRVDRAGIIAAYESGLSVREAADKHAVAKGTVRLVLKRAGVVLRPRKRAGHGSHSLYAAGCRCDECRAWRGAKWRREAERARARG